MQQKDAFGYALELVQAHLSEAPRVSYVFDARSALDAFLLDVADASVNADIHQFVVALLAADVSLWLRYQFRPEQWLIRFFPSRLGYCGLVGRAVSETVKFKKNRLSV